jgi:hypothetical protein
MPIAPGSNYYTQEIQTSTIGDQAPTPAVGSLVLFPNQNGIWYAKNSSGVVTALAGVTSVTNSDGTITITGTGASPIVSRAGITGDITIAAGSNASVLKNTGPGATGPIGAANTTPIVTIDAQGRVTALTSATITPAAIGAPSGSGTSSGTNTGDQTITLTGPVTGSGTGSFATTIGDAQVTNANLVDRAANSVMGNNTGSTGDVIDLTQTQLTAMVNNATAALSGAQSAAQFSTVAHLWFDVTNYGVTTGNTGSANTSAMNTLIQTTAPSGSKFFFPETGANYPFNGAIVVTQNDQTFLGTGQYGSVLFQDATADDLFRVNNGVQNVTFKDMGMWCTVTMTSGSAINCGTASGTGVSQLLVDNVGFQGFGGAWFNCISLSGNVSGISTIINGCQINAYTNWGVACIGNTTTPSTVAAVVMMNTTMNGTITSTTGAVAGVYIQQAGAFQIISCDIISNTNNLLVSPLVSTAQIVASVYVLNSYFDHSFGSSVKLAGAGAIVRCKFIQCYLTISGGSTGYSALEIAGTGVIEGISFIGCSFLNTFSNSGTSNGILISNVYDFQAIDNVISGFTNGIQVTPISTAATTRITLLANVIGPGGGITGNTTGVLLNAGSATYGSVQIVDNTFPLTQGSFNANTTNLTDNSTTPSTAVKIIANNSGMPGAPVPMTAASAAINTTETYPTAAIYLPPNSPLAGSTYRLTLFATCTSTVGNVSTFTVRVGTTGTTPASDTTATAALATSAASASGTTIPFRAEILCTFRTVGASTTVECALMVTNTGTTGILAVASAGAIATTGAYNNNTALYLNVSYKAAAATTTSTFQMGVWEILKQ